MKVKYFSIPVILLVLLSGISLISGSAVNSAYARYATGANTQTQANSNECDNTATCAITSPLVQGDRSTSAATNTQNPQFNEEGEGHLSGSSIESTPGPTTPGGPTTPATSTVKVTVQCEGFTPPDVCPPNGFLAGQVTADAVSPISADIPPSSNSATFTFAFPSTYQMDLVVPLTTFPIPEVISSPSCDAILSIQGEIHISGNVPPPGQSTECVVTLVGVGPGGNSD